MSRRLRAFVLREEQLTSADSGVRPSVPHAPAGEPIESDLPPPFTPRPVDRDAGRYFASSNPPAAKVHVLVVEDDEVIASSIAESLTESGHAAVSANNLTEARVYLAVAMPEVMVLDLNLDGEFGGDLLAELATLREAPATVLVSAYPFAGLVAERYGVELLRKPFGLDELDRAIERARKNHRRPRQPPLIAR